MKKNQKWQGLKLLTPDQMLSRLPISLVQSKAGNNSEKLKNDIRQLLYSLNFSNKYYLKYYLKCWKQFLWTLKIVRQMNLTDLD